MRTAALDRLGAALRLVEVERRADLVGEPAQTVAQDLASGEHDRLVALDLLDRGEQPDVAQPAVRVLQGQPLALGELGGQRFGAERQACG